VKEKGYRANYNFTEKLVHCQRESMYGAIFAKKAVLVIAVF
jgi:hypothetical protein